MRYVALFFLLIGVAHADIRMDDIADKWNSGDSLSPQVYLDNPYYQAALGLEIEHGGTVEVAEDDTLLVNGRRMKFHPCPSDPTKYCAWTFLDKPGFGSMEQGQALDAATTAGAMLAGFGELNPLGVGIFPMKIAAIHYANSLPYEGCVEARTWLDAMGWGAGVANIVTLLTGAANPLIPLAMMAVGTAYRYDDAQLQATRDCR